MVSTLHTAVVDIGSPKNHALGWAIDGPKIRSGGGDIDKGIDAFSEALEIGPLALGFEAPMFVPFRNDPSALTNARTGEGNRPFSAGAGAAVLVTGLVVVPYILSRLRSKRPRATVTQDWRLLPTGIDELLVFEAFVSNNAARHENGNEIANEREHIEDARLALGAFGLSIAQQRSAIQEPQCFSLLGAMLLRTGWTLDLQMLNQDCLVVKP